MTSSLVALAALGSLLLIGALGIGGALLWAASRVRGDAYFGRPLAERRRLRQRMQRLARVLVPPLTPLARLLHLRMPVAEYGGVRVPMPPCTLKAMQAAAQHRPDSRDVFVATQMKCGTTWMQQIVYEVLSHGKGDLGDAAHRHLYALSPWIEAQSSVSMEDAPRVGSGQHRIVKTHLPSSLCPYSDEARYVYVVRDPLACFASCVDFVRKLGGPLSPSSAEFVDWFCSDHMWWRSWPEHVEGWWRWSRERPNVLFVHYEQLLEDLEGGVREVASFLGVELSGGELADVVRKSGFAYMKANEELFEMAPPTPFDTGRGSFLVSGRRERDRDVTSADRARIAAFCRERLEGSSYPLARFYPGVAS